MALRKTGRGRDELASARGALRPFERRVLILCDGQRDPQTLERLLGPGTPAALDRLHREGYLEPHPPAHSPVPVTRAATAVATSPASPATSGSTEPARESRRSWAAARMYLIDMLSLQRGNEAVASGALILRKVDPTELPGALLQALRLLRTLTSDRIALSVADRLATLAPEAFLPHLEAERQTWTAPRAGTAQGTREDAFATA